MLRHHHARRRRPLSPFDVVIDPDPDPAADLRPASKARGPHPELPCRGEHRARDLRSVRVLLEPDTILDPIVRCRAAGDQAPSWPSCRGQIVAQHIGCRLPIPGRCVERLAIWSGADPLGVAQGWRSASVRRPENRLGGRGGGIARYIGRRRAFVRHRQQGRGGRQGLCLRKARSRCLQGRPGQWCGWNRLLGRGLLLYPWRERRCRAARCCSFRWNFKGFEAHNGADLIVPDRPPPRAEREQGKHQESFHQHYEAYGKRAMPSPAVEAWEEGSGWSGARLKQGSTWRFPTDQAPGTGCH
jgi:hypothetical protein